ncbi:hypothetical protein FKP32DRAFT_1689579 [Trametes sanguinea]|nr:hypothetical protein FKP32DRAFT_1689579 [Trametes sanguinea]
MAFFATLERGLQDSANIATTSGLTLTKLTPTLTPGVYIRQGNQKLIAVGECLRTICLPKDLEKEYFHRQNLLLTEARRLLKEKERLGFFKQVLLIYPAIRFSEGAANLYDAVMLSSEEHLVRRYLQYSISTQSLESWEHVAPPSPQIAPADTTSSQRAPHEVPLPSEDQGKSGVLSASFAYLYRHRYRGNRAAYASVPVRFRCLP